MKSTYSEKLKSPAWQRRRLEVLNARNWACEDCGTSSKELHVHHYHYFSGREPWQYRDDELRVCCGECHRERQGIEDSIKSALTVIFRSVPNKRLAKFAQFTFRGAMLDLETKGGF